MANSGELSSLTFSSYKQKDFGDYKKEKNYNRFSVKSGLNGNKNLSAFRTLFLDDSNNFTNLTKIKFCQK